MSAAPLLPPSRLTQTSLFSTVLPDTDEVTHPVTGQGENLVNRAGAARGVLFGIALGAMAWAGIILAGARLIR